jgi:hypothetical protein
MLGVRTGQDREDERGRVQVLEAAARGIAEQPPATEEVERYAWYDR